MARQISGLTLDGTALDTVNYETFLLAGMMVSQTGDLSLSPQTVAGGDPADGGQVRNARQIVAIHRYLVGGTSKDDARKEVKALYDAREGERTLTFDYDGTTYAARVRLVKLVPEGKPNGEMDRGIWELRSHVYYKSSADTYSDTGLNSSPASVTVTNAGSVAARDAQITITPTAAKSAADGQRYWVPVTVVPKCPRGGYMPLELTGSGWDHAAEVTASRSASTGYDVEIYRMNKRLPVWDGAGSAAFNQAGTRLWVGDDVPPMLRWRITANLTDSQTTIAFLDEIGDMPPAPFPLQIGSGEVVMVTAKDEDERSVTVTRAQRGTSAAAVTKSTYPYAYRAVAYDILYGWTSAGDPEYDDRFKPIPAENQSSTNSRWYFTYYQEKAAANEVSRPYPRPGSWGLIYDEELQSRQDLWTHWIPWDGASLGANATPASSLQIAYLSAGARPYQPIAYGWSLPSVVAQSTVTYNQVTSTITFPASTPWEARLEVRGISPDGANYRGATHSGTSTTGNSVTFPVGVVESIFLLHPYDPTNREYVTSANTPPEPGDNNGFIVTTVDVAFVAAEVPTIIFGTRDDAYQFGRPGAPAEVKAVNVGATAERVMYLHGCFVAVDSDLVIDVNTGQVDDSMDRGMGNAWSGVMPEIYPGAGTVKYVDDTIGTVSISVDVKAARN